MEDEQLQTPQAPVVPFGSPPTALTDTPQQPFGSPTSSSKTFTRTEEEWGKLRQTTQDRINSLEAENKVLRQTKFDLDVTLAQLKVLQSEVEQKYPDEDTKTLAAALRADKLSHEAEKAKFNGTKAEYAAYLAKRDSEARELYAKELLTKFEVDVNDLLKLSTPAEMDSYVVQHGKPKGAPAPKLPPPVTFGAAPSAGVPDDTDPTVLIRVGLGQTPNK